MEGIDRTRLLWVLASEDLAQDPKLDSCHDSGYRAGLRTAKVALLRECKELNPWQPIVSAPLSRPIRLFFNKDYGVGQVQGELLKETDRRYYTHWQELPEDPT